MKSLYFASEKNGSEGLIYPISNSARIIFVLETK
jgi:hypothetical protein